MGAAVRGILISSLAVIAALIGGTIAYVYDRSSLSHQTAVDRCHDAGGAWVPKGERSFAGACLRVPGTSMPGTALAPPPEP